MEHLQTNRGPHCIQGLSHPVPGHRPQHGSDVLLRFLFFKMAFLYLIRDSISSFLRETETRKHGPDQQVRVQGALSGLEM